VLAFGSTLEAENITRMTASGPDGSSRTSSTRPSPGSSTCGRPASEGKRMRISFGAVDSMRWLTGADVSMTTRVKDG
jgi:hypothetical protein